VEERGWFLRVVTDKLSQKKNTGRGNDEGGEKKRNESWGQRIPKKWGKGEEKQKKATQKTERRKIIPRKKSQGGKKTLQGGKKK